MSQRLQSRRPAGAVAAPTSRATSGPLPCVPTTSATASLSENLPAVESLLEWSTVNPAHVLLDLSQMPARMPASAGPSSSKRPRKERGPNWTAEEVRALVEVKKAVYIENVGKKDERELMIPDACKWQTISTEMKKLCVSPIPRDGPTCKSKWNQLIPEYKRVADFIVHSGNNDMRFWNLSLAERKAEGLPNSFPQDVFFSIHSWYHRRPTICPPHSRDLLSPVDSNYATACIAATTDKFEECKDEVDKDPLCTPAFPEDSDNFSMSKQSPLMAVGSDKFQTLMGVPLSPASTPASPAGTTFIPPGFTLVFLSSSNNSEGAAIRKAGSTGIRRRSVSGHSLIAEATRVSADAMNCQIKKMAVASREVEKSKIEAQLRLFTEQMEYQRKRDQRLHDNARLANENARLLVLKQGEMVTCLTQLSTVLSVDLLRKQSPASTASRFQPAGIHTNGQAQDPNAIVPTNMSSDHAEEL